MGYKRSYEEKHIVALIDELEILIPAALEERVAEAAPPEQGRQALIARARELDRKRRQRWEWLKALNPQPLISSRTPAFAFELTSIQRTSDMSLAISQITGQLLFLRR